VEHPLSSFQAAASARLQLSGCRAHRQLVLHGDDFAIALLICHRDEHVEVLKRIGASAGILNTHRAIIEMLTVAAVDAAAGSAKSCSLRSQLPGHPALRASLYIWPRLGCPHKTCKSNFVPTPSH